MFKIALISIMFLGINLFAAKTVSNEKIVKICDNNITLGVRSCPKDWIKIKRTLFGYESKNKKCLILKNKQGQTIVASEKYKTKIPTKLFKKIGEAKFKYFVLKYRNKVGVTKVKKSNSLKNLAVFLDKFNNNIYELSIYYYSNNKKIKQNYKCEIDTTDCVKTITYELKEKQQKFKW